MRQQNPDAVTWHITEVRDEAPSVKTLVLETDGERPEFIAGQYLTVLLPGFEPVEGKSYSISSPAQEDTVALTVKAMGAFSEALCAKKMGDILTTTLPYGFFYPESDEVHDLAFVAGGIGITPCISIIETLARSGYSKNMTLFYSNCTRNDIVFKERLDALAVAYENVSVHYFITREDTGENMHAGRMNADSILKKLDDPSETDFFICGSIDFTKSLWKELKDAGVNQNQLYTEGFY